jgi:hypothetical protein
VNLPTPNTPPTFPLIKLAKKLKGYNNKGEVTGFAKFPLIKLAKKLKVLTILLAW